MGFVVAGTIQWGHSCYHFWTMGTITNTVMAPTRHEAQSRHCWHQNKLSFAPWVSPVSEHLTWMFCYLEILLCGKSLTGQKLEEKEANRGDDSDAPVIARRDRSHPYPTRRSIDDICIQYPLMHMANHPFKAVHYLCSELCEFPADAGSTPNLNGGGEWVKGLFLKTWAEFKKTNKG